MVRRYLDRWTRELVRRGVRSGLIGGSNLWLSIGAIAWLLRLLARRPTPKASVARLGLGESVVVSHVPAPPRSRRARAKAAREAAKLEQRQAKRETGRRHARAMAKAAGAQAAREAKSAREATRADEPGRPRPEGDVEEPA